MAAAVDSSSISSNPWTSGAGPISWSHVASADSGLQNTIGLVFTAYESLPAAAAPTWGGAAMTLVNDAFAGLGGVYSVYAIVNPTYSTSGTTISFDWSTGTSYHNGIAVLLTGANQSAILDAYGDASQSASGTFAAALTTIADNCLVLCFVYNTGGATVSAGANTTMLSGTGESITSGRANSVTTPAGSTTLNFSRAGTPNWYGVLVSIAPAAGAAPKRQSNLLLMGVG